MGYRDNTPASANIWLALGVGLCLFDFRRNFERRGLFVTMSGFIQTTINFKAYPTVVRNAILFLVAGWLVHYYFFFTHLEAVLFSDMETGSQADRTVYLQLGVGIGICYFVAAINRWARALCLWFNFIIIVTYGLLFYIFVHQNDTMASLLTAIVALLFSGATYYLLNKKTAEYFRTYGLSDPAALDRKKSDT